MEPPVKKRRFSQEKQRVEDMCDRLAISLGELDIGIAVHHQLAVRESLASKDARQPIVFRIVTPGDSNTYAWWPLLEEKVAIRVLDALYVTLVFGVHGADEKSEHRILIDCMLIMMTDYKNTMITRDRAAKILEEYFGTSKLGTMKKVHFHGEQQQRGYGEMDFYHLPLKVTTYTWLGL